MGELFNQERATELYGKEMAREAAREAEYKKSLDIAKKLLRRCMSIDDVAEATSLPIEEVKALSANLCA
ncbi:MAG: hypothetical protein SO119_04375 [Phascolarctobacterium sp.]|nr:hypothetical protein [Phascolarctobacterium sp.]